MPFDWTLRIDTLFMAISFLLGWGAIWGAVRSDLRTITKDVAELKSAQTMQTKILVEIGRTDVMFKDLERRVMRLEDGK